LTVLRETGLPFGVYANLGAPEAGGGFQRSEQCSPGEFAEHVGSWLDAGAKIVGGCCGTVPADIRAAVQLVRNRFQGVSHTET
jgi:S-methylmethionine-dependent homocysteine/selenocysteine methylase